MKSIDKLVEQLQAYNEAYRRGSPLISDRQYDEMVEELRRLDPSHAFLHRVEPEILEGKREVRHPEPMLSIEKAYDTQQLDRFLQRVAKEAADIVDGDILYKVTVKLDGLAGRDDGRTFASRGNGEVGYEISSAFKKGVVAVGGRGLGLGEIVVVKSYFDAHLADKFEHPRNMVVGIVSSDTLNTHASTALQDGMVRFVPYSTLPHWIGSGTRLLAERDTIVADLLAEVDYPVDGVVVEVVDESVRRLMGATAHHYRWQVALKSKGKTAIVRVRDIIWQVGRTGSVTPVMSVSAVSLSGATIRRVTGHHAGLIRDQRIGPGAEIEIIRSGEVIPKLEKVIKPAVQIQLPERCPSCHRELVWRNDFLKCVNPRCPAQTTQRISHWFRTLGNADWFGIKTVQKLVENGYDSLDKIYALNADRFQELGFGPVQSKNLADAIATSISKPVADWRFLAALGIPNLGTGDSRKILGRIKLENLLEASPDDIKAVHGFGDITSKAIHAALQVQKPIINRMLALGFQLERTPLSADTGSPPASPLAAKRIVFTGKMATGSREDMQAQARALGAIVQTAVGAKTDLLVCGQNVGRSKMDKARKRGVQIMSEVEYLSMLGDYGSVDTG